MGQLQPPAASEHMKYHLHMSVSTDTALVTRQLNVRLYLLEHKEHTAPFSY